MNHAILLLAGSGTRLTKTEPKQFIKINNKFLFEYSLDIFNKLERINEIVLVIRKDDEDFISSFINSYQAKKKIRMVIGGSSRQESVYNALKSIDGYAKKHDNILIHDACRPNITERLLIELIDTLDKADAVSAATPIRDSLCKAENNKIEKSLSRINIFALQTPQAFKFDIIYSAHLEAKERGQFNYTDDTSLVKEKGIDVQIVDGGLFNFKITTFDDLFLFKKLVEDK